MKLLDGMHNSQDPLTVTRGKVHECLGIAIDFSMKRDAAFSQCNFIKKFWLSLPNELRVLHRNSPALDYVFKVGRNVELLDEEKKDEYHSTTAKSIFLTQQTRIDMQLPTEFHCARVKQPDVQD